MTIARKIYKVKSKIEGDATVPDVTIPAGVNWMTLEVLTATTEIIIECWVTNATEVDSSKQKVIADIETIELDGNFVSIEASHASSPTIIAKLHKDGKIIEEG